MAERVLSTRELNRAVLARQLLLERAELTPEQAVERVAGLQTQYAPSGYIGLWSRLAGFRREELTEALLAGRVVQAWVMRCTIHMVAAGDYWPFTEAVRAARRDWWRRSTRGADAIDMAAVATAVRGYLADGPRKQAEIQERLAADGYPREVWQGVQLWVDLVRVPPAGTWGTPRAHVYGLAEHTVPVPDPEPAEAAAMELLAARYLRAFGPAAPADVASFCGWSTTAARAVLGRMDLCGTAPRPAASWWTCRERRCRPPPPRLPSVSSGSGTPTCWCTSGGRRSCRRSTGRGCSRGTCRSRCPRSSSTARSPARGATSTVRCGARRSSR
jgi:hypothetical protein